LQEKSSVWLDELRKERLQSSSRNPGIAALMSFFFMGLGQIYAGHIDRGIMLMGINLSSIFSVISIYNRGMVYEMISPFFGTSAIILLCYFLCVIYFLLWIYNIKDAYYLSLFSSFRDWFEVERVLLPVLKVQSENLLTGPDQEHDRIAEPINSFSQPASQTAQPDAPVMANAKTENSAEDADVIDITHKSAEDSKTDDKTDESVTSEKTESAKTDSEEIDYAAVDSLSFNSQSWKLYVGLVLIFLLIGVWFQRRENSSGSFEKPSEETLFAIAADLPDEESVAKAKDGIDVAPGKIITEADNSVSEAKPEQSPKIEDKPEIAPAKLPFAAGLELAARGNYSQACAEFEKDLAAHKPDKNTWSIILNAFYRNDNRLAYELHLRKYLEQFSEDSSAWFNLGKILYDREEFAQASQAIVKGLKHDQDNVRGNFLLGSIYSDLNLYEDAAIYLKKAVSFEPLNLEFVLSLARSLQNSGQNEEALKYYQRVLSLNASHQEASEAIKAINQKYTPSRDETAALIANVPGTNSEASEKIVIIQGKESARIISKSEKTQTPSETNETGKVLFASDDADESEAIVEDEFDEQNDALIAASLIDETPEEAASIVEVQKVAAPVVIKDKAKSEKNAEELISQKLQLGLANSKSEPHVIEEPVKLVTEPENAKTQVSDKPEQKTARTPAQKPVQVQEAAVKVEEKPVDNRQNVDAKLMNAVAVENTGAEEAIEALRKSAFNEYSRGNWDKSLPLYLEYLKKRKDPRAYDVVSIIFEKLGMSRDAFDACEHAYNLGLRELPNLIRLGKLAEKTGNYESGEKYLDMALEKSPHRIDLRIRYARCLAMNGRKNEAIGQLQLVKQDPSASYSVKTKVNNEIKLIGKMTN
jgi:tetratricopeptide (TPR) repeat protein